MLSKKRWTCILFFIAFALFPAVCTAEESVFDGTVLSGESIDVDEFTFIITMNKYANRIFINAGDMFQSVPIFTCKKMEWFEICFDNTTYDMEENDLYAEVRILRYKPQLSMTRVFNATEFWIGQDAEVVITIRNAGDTASKIILTDDYPASIKIYDLEGCQQHENQVYWQGHLNEGEVQVCRFLIQGTEELHQNLVALLKYWDGFRWEDEYSASDRIDIRKPALEIYSLILREDSEIEGRTLNIGDDDDSGVNVGETARLVLNISNEYDDEIYVTAFDIRLPEGLKYEGPGKIRFNYINASGNRSGDLWTGLRMTDMGKGLLRWNGWLRDNRTSRLFILKLSSSKTGIHNIFVSANYETDEGRFLYTTQEEIEISDPGIALRMSVSDEAKRFSTPERLSDSEDDETSIDLEALHPYRITVYAQNRNKFADIFDVDIQTYTDLAGFSKVHYGMMEAEGRMIPYSLVLIPPPSETDKEYKLNFTAGYSNIFGEHLVNSTEFSVTVKQFTDISISHSISEGSSLAGNEETDITVSLDNSRLVDIKNVYVEDIVPQELSPRGVHSNRLKLLAETETDVYTYNIRAPVVRNETRFNITTIVRFFDPDLEQEFNFSEVTTMTVTPLVPDVAVTRSWELPEDIYLGSLIPVTYTITNEETDEIVRDITLRFPVMEGLDTVGPETFFINKLDPGESVDIEDILKIRPKEIKEDVRLGPAILEFYDDFGYRFTENISEDDTFDVEESMISGPSLFIKTVVPEITNITAEGTVRIEVQNIGTETADVAVTQGSQAWNITVPARSTERITYNLKYDREGNYSIVDPVARFELFGFPAYTKGKGEVFAVKMIYGPEANVTEEKAVVEEEPPELEKEEMSFAEWEAIESLRLRKQMIRFGISGVIALVVLAVRGIYFRYRKG
ncbi:hypothetical protein KY362_00490, partial [Candidatus Woesearchaeota archaeon]|nr:hypothetical protein [Candidatus Woesearchaeota archaeon]